jgi:superfamily II DNA or RNA helicase
LRDFGLIKKKQKNQKRIKEQLLYAVFMKIPHIEQKNMDPFLMDTQTSPLAVEITPRAHQIEALDALRDGLARADRTQAHMCCGSGKTYTQAFLARHIIDLSEDPGRVIIVCFVPNRTLIHQNARNFKTVLKDSVEYLGVCSDVDLTGIVEDEEETLHTTTDIDTIRTFAARKGKPRILISTYQSALTLRESLSKARGALTPIDLGLFDEAHRTAGNKTVDDLFAFALDNSNFPMKKRAFFTATPRIVESKKSEVLSMSNPELYGSVAYEYPFSRGIEDGNVVDYDLWVPVITRKELLQFLQETGLDAEERVAVGLIALQKVMEKTGQTRFLTYHNRIASSKAFAKQLKKVFKGTDTLIEHVDGSTPGKQRDTLMKALSKGRTIIPNCKAFVEGVDAPGLQGALFVDARKSVVDVVQAVGRLSRPDPNDPTKRGSIIAPILAESADPKAIMAAANAAGFKTLVQVAEALRANDDALEEDIMAKSRAIGRGDIQEEPLKNLQVIGPEGEDDVDLSELALAITMVTMQDLKDTFATQVGELEKYIQDHGYLPSKNENSKLHSWIASVRKKHLLRQLEPVHAELLDDVEGWFWVTERMQPEKIAQHISVFRDRSQRMPSGKRGKDAEANLHAHLMDAQERYLRFGPGRGGRLTDALEDENLLFFTDEVLGKRAQQSGHFKIVNEDTQTPKVYFIPRLDKHRKTVPVFKSGHTVFPRPVKLHVGRVERERIQALSETHSVRLTLARAGIEKTPFEDGRIVTWHAGTVDRGENPESSLEKFSWLVARLKDRKVSGRPPYTVAGLTQKETRSDKPATTLNPKAPQGTIADVVSLMERIRLALYEDRLDEKLAEIMDTLPGFSWLEPENISDRLAPVIDNIFIRHGNDIFSSRNARLADTGLSNTLRLIDSVIETDPTSDIEIELKNISHKDALTTLYKFSKSQNLSEDE